jgi:hypothetical protein
MCTTSRYGEQTEAMRPFGDATQKFCQLLPHFSSKLLDNVHPPNWISPMPEGRYNLVVIGAGQHARD